MLTEHFKPLIAAPFKNRSLVSYSVTWAAWLVVGVLATSTTARADQPLACRQLSSVYGSPTPTYSADTADVQLIVGDHYWACPCGEARHLLGDSEQRKIVGDSEQRKIVGDSEQRKIVGDSEQRKIVGDSEQRKIVGDSEQRKIVGDSEQRKIVGDSEQRKIVGDAEGLQCRRDRTCAGFVLMGANISGITVVARNGLQPAQASCIVPY